MENKQEIYKNTATSLIEGIKANTDPHHRRETVAHILHCFKVEEGIEIIKYILSEAEAKAVELTTIDTIFNWMNERSTRLRKTVEEVTSTLADVTRDRTLADILRSFGSNIIDVANPDDLRMAMYINSSDSEDKMYKEVYQDGFEEGYQKALENTRSKRLTSKLTNLDL